MEALYSAKKATPDASEIFHIGSAMPGSVGMEKACRSGHEITREVTLAFTYINPAYSKPGTALSVIVPGNMRRAMDLDAPVYDPENHLPRVET